MSTAVGEQSSRDLYRQYAEQARQRWLSGQTATVSEIRSIYRSAGHEVARDIRRLLPTQPSARHLSAIRGALSEAATNLSQESLRATLNGITLAHSSAVTGAQRVASIYLGDSFAIGGIRAMYHSINQRAVLAFATRTRRDGLRLSERVWRHGQQVRREVGSILEHGIARGVDSRKLAVEVGKHLDPSKVSPHSSTVRQRLRISKSVDHRAMRLARTEMSMAFREGTVLGHSRTPSYRGSQWELSAGHPFEDDCDDLVGFYTAGNEPLTPHPSCMCVLSPVHEDLDQFADRLGEWVDDPSSDSGLESWYQETARPFFTGRPSPRVPARAAAPRGAPTTTGTQRGRLDLPDVVTKPLERSAAADTGAEARAFSRTAQSRADDLVEQLPDLEDPELRKLIDDLTERAKRAEPRISNDVRQIINDVGGEQQGFKFRLKVDPKRQKLASVEESKIRVAQKALEDMDNFGLSRAEAVGKVGDTVRYTMTVPEAEYASSSQRALSAMRSQYDEIAVKNKWTQPDYHGINTNFRDPNTGQIFEFQIHTDASFVLKEGRSHELYEVMRDSRRQASERQTALDELLQLWKEVPIPDGALAVS